jgi:hypothetical protein
VITRVLLDLDAFYLSSPEHRRAAIERVVTRRPATDYPAAASAEEHRD